MTPVAEPIKLGFLFDFSEVEPCYNQKEKPPGVLPPGGLLTELLFF